MVVGSLGARAEGAWWEGMGWGMVEVSGGRWGRGAGGLGGWGVNREGGEGVDTPLRGPALLPGSEVGERRTWWRWLVSAWRGEGEVVVERSPRAGGGGFILGDGRRGWDGGGGGEVIWESVIEVDGGGGKGRRRVVSIQVGVRLSIASCGTEGDVACECGGFVGSRLPLRQ